MILSHCYIMTILVVILIQISYNDFVNANYVFSNKKKKCLSFFTKHVFTSKIQTIHLLHYYINKGLKIQVFAV